ncbi:MAG TPA: hypothetical protein H9799_07230 [Candidatus Mediterraneibacter merdipullorum]|nr:hypothetical protein [Candidatus Mediterraneibacter merdipullorum]
MAGRKCSLCGGRLSDNRCTFCGLDNSIYSREEQMQTIISTGQRRAEHEIHTGQEQAARTAAAAQHYTAASAPQYTAASAPQYTAAPQQYAPASAGKRSTRTAEWASGKRKAQAQTGSPRSASVSPSRAAYEAQKSVRRKKRLILIIVVIIILFSVLPALIEAGQSLLSDMSISTDGFLGTDDNSEDGFLWTDDNSYDSLFSSDDYDDYAYDPYEDVPEEIPETGDAYETVLGNGTYIVGLHIPEGVYTATLVEGSGSLTAESDDFSLYEHIYFGTEPEYNEVTEQEDLPLYNGETVSIGSGVLVQLETSNAQPLTEEPSANPLTESVFLEEGTYTVGDGTVPEGTYDVTAQSDEYGFGYASISLLYPNETSGYYWVDSPEFASISDEYTSISAKNVILPEGTEITIEYGDIVLEPSETYFPIDYAQYP